MIVFIAVIGVLSASLISLAYSGSKSSKAYRQERVVRYNAESALQTTVLRLQRNPLIGTDATSTGTPPLDASCAMNLPMQQDTTQGAKATFVAGSVLSVTCGPTCSTTTSTGSCDPSVAGGSGGLDGDGGQKPRDITITVTCKGPAAGAPGALLDCRGSGASTRVVAKARVRFEIDTTAANQSQRATIPKIVSWDTSR
ncbi:hypothetical protein KSP35_14345 [Aquihabitans sp. G128]|uniref:hypothetical protein n=1 Tax=Aquihabitans sp. G128 TaxID=2849779 RepID=UPI001C224C18|nr:hypothetical protein [Aquihabitans sp. G128]QXC59563.1 hypothetical protein KSP35_14345 [Aquihabitans sp. G128]